MRIFTVYLNLFYYKSFYSSMFKMNFLNAYTKLQTHTETIFFFIHLVKSSEGSTQREASGPALFWFMNLFAT